MAELAQCASLLSSVLSLLAVAHLAFFSPAGAGGHPLLSLLSMMLLSGAVCLGSGALWSAADDDPAQNKQNPRQRTIALVASLPMRVFWWGGSGMILLYSLSSYLETHFIVRSFTRWP